ncbi:MAG: UDP-N-acetylglucosamine 4,6-dehydratase [Fluviicola sp.]|jgi:FlaA1/EpsC-like NDP-sugar epimerase|uniref:UDP-N-acetylglucosamine 4,6-dehydratase n=1 Tax=Fluviicola sp. TaxID=1917219 RepID=UPI002602360C|nr:UDP-N-acetylglucosamine 4,6-dehydratase [Fluviicola sp.]MDF3027323.1 UDP-N-acetylglucosamine 4,6-dehydratase [Fluviicola sp.]
MDILELIGRKRELFSIDIENNQLEIDRLVSSSHFLVIGGAGSIGKAVVKEIFKRNPLKLHVVDISENNLVELVRDLRSTYGYIDGDFRTFALDAGSKIYDAFIKSDGEYDYVLNLSALKHVRSEKDPYTLMRMLEVNVLNTIKTVEQSIANGAKKYFCVSTDKAANPVNLMGASKRIMEMYLVDLGKQISISSARFANVAFSDGSLLHSFEERLKQNHPIVAPNDVKRYFVTPRESGILCLMSCLFGENGEIYFPKLDENEHLVSFTEIADKFLLEKGYQPVYCHSEEEARTSVMELKKEKKWPCFYSSSDTTGEKAFEEFYTQDENITLDTYIDLGIVKQNLSVDKNLLTGFQQSISSMIDRSSWSKEELIDLFHSLLPDLDYEDKGKYLDAKM